MLDTRQDTGHLTSGLDTQGLNTNMIDIRNYTLDIWALSTLDTKYWILDTENYTLDTTV